MKRKEPQRAAVSQSAVLPDCIVKSKSDDFRNSCAKKRLFAFSLGLHGFLYAPTIGHLRINVFRGAVKFPDNDSSIGCAP